MDVRWVTPTRVEDHHADEVSELLKRDDGFVWVDVPSCDSEAADHLERLFGFHPMALRDCRERTMVPKMHVYPEEVFLIIHAPDRGVLGHVHLLELDQFVSARYLVTVHGPLGEGVALDRALRETRSTLERMEQGRFHPGSPFELSYAIVSAIARRMEELLTALASEIAALDRKVMAGGPAEPQQVVEEMFRLRHQVVTVQTMANQSHDVFARLTRLARAVPPGARPLIDDLLDQFTRVASLAHGEKEFLQGVIDLYQTRTATELNLFAKQLSAIGAILVAVTVIAGIYGMNFEHMPEFGWRLGYVWALALMALTSVALYTYFRRRRWL